MRKENIKDVLNSKIGTIDDLLTACDGIDWNSDDSEVVIKGVTYMIDAYNWILNRESFERGKKCVLLELKTELGLL